MKKVILIFLFTTTIFAQQEQAKDTLNAGEITVVKPYTPTISDAFKIKENPSLKNDNTIAKDSVSYTINSVPVASTFTPTKGKAKGLAKEKMPRIYDNYISVGFGNNTTPFLNGFIHSSTSRYNDFGARIGFLSSKGNVKDALLNTNFSDANLNLYYKQFDRDYNWQVNAGATHQISNWYGLPTNLTYTEPFLNAIDPKQTYLTIFVGGQVNFEDGIFKGAKIEVNQFSDAYKSSETNIVLKPTIEFPISSELITTTAIVEFTKGNFKQNYFTTDPINYGFLKLGIAPNFEVLRNNLTVNLGAKIYYNFDLENSVNKLFAYPNVTASYKITKETVIAYAGITGDLIQNTYKNYAQNNPFVSPTLNIQQTDNIYNGFVGVKGKLNGMVSYNIKAMYGNEKNKPLHIQNPSRTGTLINVATNDYQLGNSFNVVYDNVKTITALGEINVDLSKELKLGSTLEYFNYTTTNQDEAWNLPNIKATVFANYHNNKWFAGTDVYFVGKRYDFVTPFANIGEKVTLDSFLDLNLNAGYVFTDRLTAFAKANNILNTNYERYANFNAQGFQVLAGITYKFDL